MGDVPDRPRNPSGSLPSVGRTPTPHELAHELRKLREMMAGRLERVEEIAEGEMLEFVRKAGAKYDTVSENLVRLSEQFNAATKTVKDWRDDIRRELGDHDDRLMAIEDRSSRHHVRLDALDDAVGDQQVRVRSLERHQTETTTELALTRRQKGGVAALGSISGVLAALLARLLGG